MMVRLIAFAAALLSVVAQPPAPTPSVSNPSWSMQKIRTIQARVQSLPATWDPIKKEWVLTMEQNTNTFEEKYRAVMDTVNTASPEGALMYVQTEGIDKAVDQECRRKTNMSYIWFYDISIVQPVFSVAEYGQDTGVAPEYGKFVAMDNGMCTPTSGSIIPPECLQFNGLDYNANIGPYIGGEPRKSHPKGNYPNNYWFSFPGSCYTKPFTAKKDECRKLQQGGACPYGVEPDGVKCTFSYKVLGYIKIDDLVGITNMTKANGDYYKDRVDFCKDGKIEYDFATGKSDVPFWSDPLVEAANVNRTQKMFDFYNGLLASEKGANMKPLPNMSDIKNPPCAKNNPLCAASPNGCRRKLLAQICEVCETPGPDCIKGTSPFPTLNKQYKPPRPTDASGKPIPPSGTGSSAVSVALSSVVSVLVAALLVVN